MKNEIYSAHKSSIGNLNANIMALLCCIVPVVIAWIPVVRYVAWLIPLVLFFMEKQSKLVRFHAMQSFILHMVSAVLSLLISVVLGGILGVGSLSTATYYAAAGFAGIVGLVTSAISLVILLFAIIAMIGAYKYKETHIPIIGGMTEKLLLRIWQK
ncbi:MAG: hypothetical protein RR398_05295 [Clostridia bacterium]